jgi:CRP-like cAMP-binding protein
MRVRFEAGQPIFRERDPANRFYLIERGKVRSKRIAKTRQM